MRRSTWKRSVAVDSRSLNRRPDASPVEVGSVPARLSVRKSSTRPDEANFRRFSRTKDEETGGHVTASNAVHSVKYKQTLRHTIRLTAAIATAIAVIATAIAVIAGAIAVIVSAWWCYYVGLCGYCVGITVIVVDAGLLWCSMLLLYWLKIHTVMLY